MIQENQTKERVKEENLKDPFWVMRDVTQGDYDDEELYQMYIDMGLFKDEQEQVNAESYLAEQILLGMEEEL